MKKILFVLLPVFLSAMSNISQTTPPPQKKQASQIPKKNKNTPEISEVLQQGRFLRLTDGSLWEIRSSDRILTQSWITPADIIVEDSGDREYPYKLTNTLTTSHVLAKKAATVQK